MSKTILILHVFFLVFLFSEGVDAAKRYALIIGNNRGESSEIGLLYAEKDADKIFVTLNQVANFNAENMMMLKGQKVDSVRKALARLNARIRQENEVNSVLMVYYSGHADAESLHLNGSEFSLSELKNLVKGSAAKFRFLVVDACRSGALTRAKGGRFTAPLALSLQTVKEHEGLVVMTASAAGEDAQESDVLKGSFFSHYFSSALRGVADQNGDGAINLEELYRYTYEQTVKQSSATMAGTQHPTFQYAYRGVGEFIISKPMQNKDLGKLTFPQNMSFFIMQRDEAGDVVAEVFASAENRTIALDEGVYFVRGRDYDTLYEGYVTVSKNSKQQLDLSALERVEYARLVRKGSAEKLFSQSVFMGYQLFSPVQDYKSFCQGPVAQYTMHFQYLSVWSSLDGCYSAWHNRYIKAKELQTTLQIGISYNWDFEFASLSTGGGLGSSVYYQTFETRGVAPDIFSPALIVSLNTKLWVNLPGPFFAQAEVTGRSHILRRREKDTIFIDTPFVFGGDLGLGIEF